MSSLWSRLGSGERRLAWAALVVLGVAVVLSGAQRAVDRQCGLQERLAALENEVVSSTSEVALSRRVAARYAALAVAHASGLTEAQISDGLQSELDRLSLRPESGKQLLKVVYRPEGVLTACAGYREYQTTFTTQPTSLAAVAEFLSRLQQSPQALRVDRIDLRRDNPAARSVVAQITVTRTVVDPSAGDLASGEASA